MSSSLNLSRTPGPGTYENSNYSTLKNKDPTWSLSKSSRDHLYKNHSVGPGQYEMDRNYKSFITKTPSYQFGSDKREFVSKT